MDHPKTVIFWGAGATASLGIRTTDSQAKFIKHLTGAGNGDLLAPLKTRVTSALDGNGTERWISALCDLINILGDEDENDGRIDSIGTAQLEAMRRSWEPGATDKELSARIIHLRLFYDWPALKSVVRLCPGILADTFQINDLFNLLDMHIPQGFGFQAPSTLQGPAFLDTRRLIGASNALRMILGAAFYIDYQECIRTRQPILAKYHDFAFRLGHRMQTLGIDLSKQHPLGDPDFYQGDVSFVSLNYDPIALWMQFIANQELNTRDSVPHIGAPATPLYIYHDFGHLIPARGIGAERNKDWPWYPMNESAAQRLNRATKSDTRVRLTKFLFPHGCMCWRECPNCGKLSAYHGSEWSLSSTDLFPPPPLKAFDNKKLLQEEEELFSKAEFDARNGGKVDARACLHCQNLTYAYHTQTVMQSSFKSQPPSFIEEIRRDMRATVIAADHIILMGYSLPQDDVTYRAFFAASRKKSESSGTHHVRCTVINKNSALPGWHSPEQLKSYETSDKNDRALNAARDIFGADNVRYFGDGAPAVFMDGDNVTDYCLNKLLNWFSTE